MLSEKNRGIIIIVLILIGYAIKNREKIVEFFKGKNKLEAIVSTVSSFLVAFFVIVIMLNLNTSKWLALREKPLTTQKIQKLAGREERIVRQKPGKDVAVVSRAEDVRGQMRNSYFTLEVKKIKDTGIYMLVDEEEYGIDYHYRSDMIFKDMYTKNSLLANLYKDRYCKLFLVTLMDDSKVLIRLNHKDYRIKAGDMFPIGCYVNSFVTGYNEKLEDKLMAIETDIGGYVDMYWTNHRRGLVPIVLGKIIVGIVLIVILCIGLERLNNRIFKFKS